MKAVETFEALAASLIGEPISHVWRGYGSAIFIEIGALRPTSKRDGTPGHPEGDVSLGIEWSWRIEDRNVIRCGSWSEEGRWEPTLSSLSGARITRCELFGYLPELVLTVEGDIRILTFSTTEGQPQWYLVDRRDKQHHWFTVENGELRAQDSSEK